MTMLADYYSQPLWLDISLTVIAAGLVIWCIRYFWREWRATHYEDPHPGYIQIRPRRPSRPRTTRTDLPLDHGYARRQANGDE